MVGSCPTRVRLSRFVGFPKVPRVGKPYVTYMKYLGYTISSNTTASSLKTFFLHGGAGSAFPPEWKLHYDSPIGKMPLSDLTRAITGSVRNRKPDGVAQRSTQNECFLLEFTRTTDFWAASLDVARARKEDKEGYVDIMMLAVLQERLPGWDVRLLTF
eukprot:3421199-Rhodomonas_salina.2